MIYRFRGIRFRTPSVVFPKDSCGYAYGPWIPGLHKVIFEMPAEAKAGDTVHVMYVPKGQTAKVVEMKDLSVPGCLGNPRYEAVVDIQNTP